MIALLRVASVLPGIPIVSIAGWWFITLLEPVDTWVEFLYVLLVFFVWQSYIIYSVIFLLLRPFTQRYRLEVVLSGILGCISGTLCGFSVAGYGGFLFGFLTGPIFGVLFALVVGSIQRRNSKSSSQTTF